MEQYLGIDVGGTGVKAGMVNRSGQIEGLQKHDTADLRLGSSFMTNFLDVVSELINQFPGCSKVGMGLPGTLNKMRTTTLEVPAIPELNGFNLLEALERSFPGRSFYLENDASAAALGELYFGTEDVPDDYIFVTLGTGVGGAAIIDRKVFKGGGGNAMEVGHVLSSYGNLLEKNIGKDGLLRMARAHRRNYRGDSMVVADDTLTSHQLIKAAVAKDQIALEVFVKVGEMLGEALLAMVRLFDVKHIIIGGGLSASFDFIIDAVLHVLHDHLTPYYTRELVVKRATLGNDAGVVGAASLCF